MELFQAKDEYILQSGDRALWCSRKDGTMTVRPGTYWMTSFSIAAAGHLPGTNIWHYYLIDWNKRYVFLDLCGVHRHYTFAFITM